MKIEEALDVVGMVIVRWPQKEQWEADVMMSYAQGIVDMDAEVVTVAVSEAHKAERYRPNVAVLRAYAKEIARRRKPTSTFAGQEEDSVLPVWVKGWAVARYRDGDLRVWPEQKPGYDALQEAHPHSREYVWPEQEIMPEDKRAQYANQGAELADEHVLKLIGAA